MLYRLKAIHEKARLLWIYYLSDSYLLITEWRGVVSFREVTDKAWLICYYYKVISHTFCGINNSNDAVSGEE